MVAIGLPEPYACIGRCVLCVCWLCRHVSKITVRCWKVPSWDSQPSLETARSSLLVSYTHIYETSMVVNFLVLLLAYLLLVIGMAGVSLPLHSSEGGILAKESTGTLPSCWVLSHFPLLM